MSSEKGVATVAERPVDFLCDLERSPVVSSDPHRRGPKKHRFTRTQEMLLYLIAGETVLNGGVSMVIFFVVNKIIFPEGKKAPADETPATAQ